MEIQIWGDGWVIVPETDFERDVMRSFGCGGLKAFHKYGSTPSQGSYVGIKLTPIMTKATDEQTEARPGDNAYGVSDEHDLD